MGFFFFTFSIWYFIIFEMIIKQSLSCIWLFATPWTSAPQASLSFSISWSLLKLIFTELMPFNHLKLCHPLLLPSVFPSIKIFFSELALCIRLPKCWSFSFSISPSMTIQGWFPLGLTVSSLVCINTIDFYIFFPFSLAEFIYSNNFGMETLGFYIKNMFNILIHI